MLPSKLAFVDLETTGARSFYDRILEIGILRVEDGKITKTFHSLINPQTRVPLEIERLTGISTSQVENAPTFRQLKDEITELLADCVFVAHNVRFDYSFLRSEFMRENISFSSKHFCTVKLSRSLFPRFKHHNLDALIARFNFPCENRHRAFDDAKVLFDFYQKIQQDFSPVIVEQAVNLALKKPSLPTKLSSEELSRLPEEPGVYIFYGENNLPLYIGKSKNIKNRVLSHFSNDLVSSTEMKISQQIERVETQVTAGEMGALLIESKLIKTMLPIYNRRLRLKRELIALRKTTDENGYNTIKIEIIENITPQDFKSLIGFFRSRRQAKEYLSVIAKESMLCEKILGLEKTNSACFSYRLGSCKGACTGEEKPLMYNLRFITGLGKLIIQPWPFTSPILVTEKNEYSQIHESFLIDKWCYLGSLKAGNEQNFEEFLTQEYVFDLDVYKIIKSFVNNLQNQQKITVLKNAELNSPGYIFESV